MTRVGAAVRLARDVTFARSVFAAGELAVVQEVFDYPPGLVEGNRIYDARVVRGTFVDGSPAFSIAVPLKVADIVDRPATPAPSTQETAS